MLLEGSLSTLVIIAVAGGLGIARKTQTGGVLQGVEVFSYHYSSWASANGLSARFVAFVADEIFDNKIKDCKNRYNELAFNKL